MCFRRSYVIDDDEVKLRQLYKSKSHAELRRIQACRQPQDKEYGVIMQMLDERDFWKRFWTSGIVAWIGLALSLLSLYCNLQMRLSK
jgi:hypothetical protein